MTTQIEITQRNHHRAVRFFWCFLIGATTVSLIGNITHAVLPYIPRIVIQIGAAAVPPIALLAAVQGIALAVRAGASGRVYRWAVSAVAAIGAGAFMLSFRALRDLLIQTGTPPAWAWIFPAIVDTAVALMLVALGDKPARSTRTATAPANLHPHRSKPVRLSHLNLFPHLRDRTQFVRIRSHQVRNPHLWTPHCGPHPHQVSARMPGRTTPHSHRPWSMRVRPRSPRQWSRRSSPHTRRERR
jgi:hypothetical protein